MGKWVCLKATNELAGNCKLQIITCNTQRSATCCTVLHVARTRTVQRNTTHPIGVLRVAQGLTVLRCQLVKKLQLANNYKKGITMPNDCTLPAVKRLVGVNERGNRIGEDHPCAVLTDRDIELLFQLHEEGWGYRRLAAKFDCSKSLVRKILKGDVRGQHPTRFKPMP